MINIVVPTTFDPTLTYGLLDSMKKFNMGAEYNVTVVDNGSDPIFDYKDDKVTIIRNDQRLSFAKAMNIGIAATTDEYVLLLNNDTLIQHDNFLGNLLIAIESKPKVGIVSAMTNFICIDQARCANKENLPKKIINHNGHIAFVCPMFKRSTLNDIGLFDENFKTGAFEDGDMSERILRAGYEILIDGNSFIFHYGSKTVSQVPEYGKHFGENHAYYNKKWEIK